MRYSFASAAALLAVLPLALAKQNSIAANQTSKVEGARNVTGILTSNIEGRLNAFQHDKFNAVTALSWTEDEVNGAWSLDTAKPRERSFAGGWRTNGTNYEYGGKAHFTAASGQGQVDVESLITANANGNIEITIETSYDMKCTTTKAGKGAKAKTVCRAYAPNGLPSRRAEHIEARATPTA